MGATMSSDDLKKTNASLEELQKNYVTVSGNLNEINNKLKSAPNGASMDDLNNSLTGYTTGERVEITPERNNSRWFSKPEMNKMLTGHVNSTGPYGPYLSTDLFEGYFSPNKPNANNNKIITRLDADPYLDQLGRVHANSLGASSLANVAMTNATMALQNSRNVANDVKSYAFISGDNFVSERDIDSGVTYSRNSKKIGPMLTISGNTDAVGPGVKFTIRFGDFSFSGNTYSALVSSQVIPGSGNYTTFAVVSKSLTSCIIKNMGSHQNICNYTFVGDSK